MELASAGGAAAALWVVVATALARIRTDLSLVRRSFGLATAAMAIVYAASSPHAPFGLRLGLPAAALAQGAWLWWRSRGWPEAGRAADAGRAEGRAADGGATLAARGGPSAFRALAYAFAATAPALVALGGGRLGYAASDFVALAVFAAALGVAVLGPARWRAGAEIALSLAFYLCAWREPSGFLTIFAVVAAEAMSPGTQVAGARREKAAARSAPLHNSETVLDA